MRNQRMRWEGRAPARPYFLFLLLYTRRTHVPKHLRSQQCFFLTIFIMASIAMTNEPPLLENIRNTVNHIETVTIQILEPEMELLVDSKAVIQKIASGMKFTEGPVWQANLQQFVYSDIPANKMYQWTEEKGLNIFREPSNQANGNTTDNEGRLVTCEHHSQRVTRTEHDGTITVLADRYQGKKFNSPNDVVIKRDDSVWFSDPDYGLGQRKKEQSGNYVYRLDPSAMEPVIVAKGFNQPNGLCFSADETMLYIADSGPRHHIRRFRVTKDNTLVDDGVFTVTTKGVPDGIRIDAKGYFFSTDADGVKVFRLDGKMIGKFLTPEVASNCCFGGADGKSLFITATSSVWRIPLK